MMVIHEAMDLKLIDLTEDIMSKYILNSFDRSILLSYGYFICNEPELALAVIWVAMKEASTYDM